MRRYAIAVLAVTVGLGIGSAFGASRAQQPAAAAAGSDRAVLNELKAIHRELSTLNANVGNRYRDAPIITQLSDIKRSTQYTCKSVAPNENTPC